MPHQLVMWAVSCVCLLDCAHRPTAPLLPSDLEALGVFPPPRNSDRHLRRGPVRLRGNPGELLLHPQHLAHADRRERGLPVAPSCQGQHQGDTVEASEELRLSALRERAWGNGPGRPQHHLHQQHLHQLMARILATFSIALYHLVFLTWKKARELEYAYLSTQFYVVIITSIIILY